MNRWVLNSALVPGQLDFAPGDPRSSKSWCQKLSEMPL